MSGFETMVLRTRWEFDHSQARQSTAAVSREIDRVQDTAERMSRRVRGSYQRISEQIENSRRRIEHWGRQIGLSEDNIQRLHSRFSQAGSVIDRESRRSEIALRRLALQTGMTREQILRLRRSQKDFATEGLQGLESLQFQYAAIAGAIGVVTASALASLVPITKLGIQAEQTHVAFSTFLGDAARATEVIGDLNQFANVTPFDNASVIKAGKSLLAFGVESERLIPTLRKIGDISAATGKNFNELAVIYGKAKIAGTLYAEDINQLVEAGIPVMEHFADILGVSTAEVKRMASEGQLKFSALEETFTRLTAEGGLFFDLMAKQSETTGGLLSTLQGNLQRIGVRMGSVIANGLKPAIGMLVRLTGALAGMDEETAEFLQIAAMTGGAFLGIIAAMTAVTLFASSSFVPAMVSAATKVGVAITAATGGINLLIAGIAAALAGLAYVIYDNWAELEDIFEPLQEAWQELRGDIFETAQMLRQFLGELVDFDTANIDWIEVLRTGVKAIATVLVLAIAQIQLFIQAVNLAITSVSDWATVLKTLATEGPAAALAFADEAGRRQSRLMQDMGRTAGSTAARVGRIWRSEQEKTTAAIEAGEGRQRAAVEETEGAHEEAAKALKARGEASANLYTKHLERLAKETAELRAQTRLRERLSEGDSAAWFAAERLRWAKLADARERYAERWEAIKKEFDAPVRINFRTHIQDVGPEHAFRQRLERMADEGKLVLEEVQRKLLDERQDTAWGDFVADVRLRLTGAEHLPELQQVLEDMSQATGYELEVLDQKAIETFDLFMARVERYVENYQEPVRLEFEIPEEDIAAAEELFARLEDQGSAAVRTVREIDSKTGVVTFRAQVDTESAAAVRELKNELSEPVGFKVEADPAEVRNMWTDIRDGAYEVAAAIEDMDAAKLEQGLGRIIGRLKEVLGHIQQYQNASSALTQSRIEALQQTGEKVEWMFGALAAMQKKRHEDELESFEEAENAKIEKVRERIEAIKELEDARYAEEKERLIEEHEQKLEREESDFERKKESYARDTEDHLQFVTGVKQMEEFWREHRRLREAELQKKLDELLKASNKRKEAETAGHNQKIEDLEAAKEARLQALKEEQAAKEKELTKQQALVRWAFETATLEMSKRMQIADAKVKMAMGIVDAIKAGSQIAASIPVLGWIIGPAFTAKMIAMITAATSQAIANISSQFVMPPVELLAERGGFFRGRRHARGGIPVEIEDGEAVLTRRAMLAGETFTLPGVGRVRDYDVASTINVAAGGVSFPGAADLRRISVDSPRAFNVARATSGRAGLQMSGARITIQSLQAPVSFNVVENLDEDTLRDLVDEFGEDLVQRSVAAVGERLEGRG